MKTTQKEAILKNVHKELFALYEGHPVMTGSIRPMIDRLVRKALDTYAESKLSQIKEEIEKARLVNAKNPDDQMVAMHNDGIDTAISIITSHMEEKGGEKHD